MLSNDKKQILDQFIAKFSSSELTWISGYLAGVANGAPTSEQKKISGNLTFLYVTETGNSKFLANELAKRVKALGANVKIKSSDQYRLDDLAKETNIVFLVSTHGDGEMPASGKKFFDHISNENADFSKMNFGVIALGDSSYPLFCQAGKDVQKILLEKKAQKNFERFDLDLDFEQKIDDIYSRVLTMLKVDAQISATAKISQQPAKKEFVKKEFEGEVISNINLNDLGSSKETHHIEIAIPENVVYEPGDAIAVVLTEKKTGSQDKIPPRLYSIASSLNEHGNEIHLTVALSQYIDEKGITHQGLASGYLSSLGKGDRFQLYISKNRQFKLPEDDKDIIMVGPGTGVAPFRSFLAERNYRNASGKNWLFFGERNFRSDFLYQTEWQTYLESGLLSRMDVAFSRDQEVKFGTLRAAGNKIYVQNRMLEKSTELFKWLERGAFFYVCGDKENMARDVENALLAIIAKEGSKSENQAQEYLSSLNEQGRYLRDVY